MYFIVNFNPIEKQRNNGQSSTWTTETNKSNKNQSGKLKHNRARIKNTSNGSRQDEDWLKRTSVILLFPPSRTENLLLLKNLICFIEDQVDALCAFPPLACCSRSASLLRLSPLLLLACITFSLLLSASVSFSLQSEICNFGEISGGLPALLPSAPLFVACVCSF